MKRLLVIAMCGLSLFLGAGPVMAAEEQAPEAKEPASDEIIVKSTKVDREISQVTDSVSLITEKDLDFNKYTDFTEALRDTPGVQFKRNGGPGQFAYPKLRGFGAGHFLVVVDGMKINDSYFPGVGNFFSQLDPFIIESAEVLRGPQSVLYGSDTTAGVFALTTKGGEPGANFTLGGEYGSLDWKKGYTGFRGEQDDFRYSVNLGYTDSDGVVAYDTYQNLTPQVKLGYALGNALDLEASYFRTRIKQNFSQLVEDYGFNLTRDTWYGFELPDPDNCNETVYELATVQAKNRLSDQLSQKLTLGWYKRDHETLDKNNGLLGYITAPQDNFTLDWTTYYNKGGTVPVYDDGTGESAYTVNENYMADYNFVWDAPLPAGAGGNSLLFGAEYYHQAGKSWGANGDTEGDYCTVSLYANDQVSLFHDDLILNAGLRWNQHEEFGDKLVGKVGAAYRLPSDTTLYANWGTTFRAPSVFQLYNAEYGNPELEPEEGWTVEGGVRQQLLDRKLSLELGYWHSRLDNVIDFTYDDQGNGAYFNRSEAKTQGLEFSLKWQALAGLTFLGNYTYTDSESEADGQWDRTPQIARNVFNLGVHYLFLDRLDLGANVYYVGPRLRWRGDVEMDAYTRVDVVATWQVCQGLSLYGRIQNLFDTDIEEGLGFEEPGLYAIAGLKWDFDFARLVK